MVVRTKSKGRKSSAAKKRSALTEETTDQNAAILAKEWQGMTEAQYREELKQLKETPEYLDLRTEQVALACWLALPASHRDSQVDFAKRWGISVVTAWKWANMPVIKRLRFDMMRAFLIHYTPDILDNLRKAAMISPIIGSPTPAIKLWLQYMEDYREAVKVETEGNITLQFGFEKSKFMQPVDAKVVPPAKALSIPLPPKKNAKN